jgi:acyl-CoA thioesterase
LKQYDAETAVARTGQGSFEGALSAAWNIGDNPNGGYMVSLALAAMAASVEHPDPVSVTTHFLRPGEGGAPCVLDVDVLRAGRSLSTLRASLTQGGKARLELLAAFGDLTVPAGIDAGLTIAPPSLPPPEQCPLRTGDIQGIELPITERLETRLHPEQSQPGQAGRAEISGWIRFSDGREPDPRSLLLFADAFPPSPLGLLGLIGWVPTIELTVHVRARPAPGWICARFLTEDLKDGRMVESGALWDSEGTLVAQSRQLGLVLRRN